MTRRLVVSTGIVLLLAVTGAATGAARAGGSLPGPAAPVFVPLPATLTVPRADHAQTTLADGSVLVTGGFTLPGLPVAPGLDTAELFDAATRSHVLLPDRMRSPRTNHTATRLADGRVLLAGGQLDNNGDGIASAELYDPVSRSFTLLPATMTSPRGGHAAALLDDGTVLIAGGFDNSATALRTAEIFDPVTGGFTAVAALMNAPRSELTATRLPDGRVLLAGGQSDHIPVDTAEIYDPATGSFTALAATMTSIRFGHSAAPTAGGLVLLTGGSALGLPASGHHARAQGLLLATAEVFDPATGTFSAVASPMTSTRFAHASSALAGGRVVLSGGIAGLDPVTGNVRILDTAEMFAP